MKWVWRGVFGALGVVLLSGVVGRRYWAAQVLGYYVGAPVTVAELSLIAIGGGKWQAQLRGVQVASTEPTLPFSPLKAGRVKLTFEGLRLRSVHVEGASVVLLRQKMGPLAVRNYQRLFPRRGRGRPLSIAIAASQVHFYLYNEPAALEVHAEVVEAQGTLSVDSLWLSIQEGRIAVDQLSVCYQGKAYEGLRQGTFTFTGQYEKATDTWLQSALGLDFAGLKLDYTGKIVRWAQLEGGLHVQVDTTLLERWVAIPSFLRAGLDRSLYLSAFFAGERIDFHTWGEGPWGSYDLCARWTESELSDIAGKLHQPFLYHLTARSPDGKAWHLRAHGWYRGYPWRGWAHLRYALDSVEAPPRQPAGEKGRTLHTEGTAPALGASSAIPLTGEAHFQLGEVSGQYGGSLQKGIGKLWWKGLQARGEWDVQDGLRLEIDTATWIALSDFWRAYGPLLRGSGSRPWQVMVRQLRLSSSWVGEEVALQPGLAGLAAGGRLRYLPWDFSLHLWATLSQGGRQGRLWGKAPADNLYGEAEWQGDTVHLSVAGLLREGYYAQVAGCGELSTRRLWLTTGRLQSATGSYVEVGGVFSDSVADGSARGEVLLPEMLTYLPLKGLEVQQGVLSAEVCFQEPWQTLLSWDNQAEGWTRLEAVQGRFVRPDLPLSLRQVQVVFSRDTTRIEGLIAQVGDIALTGAAEVGGTLGYLYEDWRTLQGHATLYVENFRLSDVWRIRKDKTYLPRLLLPEKMHLQAQVVGYNVDILGFRFDKVQVQGELFDQSIRVSDLKALYRGGEVWGWGMLDARDTSCFMAAWQARTEGLPIQDVLTESGLTNVPALRALGLKGTFSGDVQAAIRFASNLTWRENSSLLASGRITNGLFYTPPFMRWLRPFYVAAYRDSMDFLARVAELHIVDGYLRLPPALVVTRVAAFYIEGTHLLAQDRFLYRLQGTRLYRKAQRYPYLERLMPYLTERLSSSLWLVYIEKDKGRVRWHYPVKLLLRRLLTG